VEQAPPPRPDASAGAGGAPPPAAEICGASDVIGIRLPPIDGPGACGMESPVRIESVAGVALDPPPVLDCATALRTRDWLRDSVKPAFLAADGGALRKLGIAAAYVCRNVNNAADGEISEHAFGRAIDVMRFGRADGRTLSVIDGWGSETDGGLLRAIHDAACGVFATSLGPETNALHANHFHYDIAERRNPYCPDAKDPSDAKE
jgi:hypothetical protein